ncbi:hypothetical protein BCR35DRAFT_304001 [Leucosporidium creatinivorum]|uniref:DUF7719 domain-containing protein n=1 Tax=Leucosporidium creatinivorum TaxID=106004 RepID=A0A1Y2FD28_9BASI|nr:hypothetical protein BCR35DRAFT_304001 [Leucosporidium creatinivorum]
MTERRRTVQTGSWTPSPSPSPPASPTEFTLSDADRLRLLNSHTGLKPSSLPAAEKDPLLVLTPEELAEKVAQQQQEAEDEEMPLWEELANALLWTIPFGFLFSGMDYAVHAQFGMDLRSRDEVGRLLNIVPTIFLLTFLVSRPKPLLHPFLIQALLFGLCLGTGIALVHITTTESYLKVMRQAPGIGTLWVWSVVRLDLGWAVLGLLGVGAGVWWRGELDSVKWW